MPKAVLEFDLNDPEDKEAHQLALNARHYKNALKEVDSLLRNKLKHGDLTEGEFQHLDEIRTRLHEELSSNNLNLFD